MDVLSELRTRNYFTCKCDLADKFLCEKIQQVHNDALLFQNDSASKFISIDCLEKIGYKVIMQGAYSNTIVCPNFSFSCNIKSKKRIQEIYIPFHKGYYPIRDVEIMEYMVCTINDSIPEWESEFNALMDAYATEIYEAQLKTPYTSDISWRGYVDLELSLFSHFRTFRGDILDVNPQLINQLQREGFEVEQQYLGEQENDYKIKLKNYSLTIRNGLCEYEILGDIIWGNEFIITPESLRELDAKIPQWIEQGKLFEREYAKRHKLQEIGFQSIEVLVKNKMRELHIEYVLEKEDDGSAVFKVKANAKRYVKFKISPTDLQKVQEKLNTISQSMELLKQIPSFLKIGTYGNNVQWKKEE